MKYLVVFTIFGVSILYKFFIYVNLKFRISYLLIQFIQLILYIGGLRKATIEKPIKTHDSLMESSYLLKCVILFTGHLGSSGYALYLFLFAVFFFYLYCMYLKADHLKSEQTIVLINLIDSLCVKDILCVPYKTDNKRKCNSLNLNKNDEKLTAYCQFYWNTGIYFL